MIVRVTGRVRLLRRRVGDAGLLAALVAASLVLAAVAATWPDEFRPAVLLALPVLIGGLLLRRREMRMLLLAVLVLLVATVGFETPSEDIGSLVVLLVVSATAYELARRRERLGVREGRADVIVWELRERLRVQGTVPPLVPGWGVEVALRSAHDAGMAGDFVAARVHDSTSDAGRDGRVLDLALVDVSGKGVDAGTRALLLSGALGGLLGAVPPERFLVEANRYLREQRWLEGFATAVYLRVELDSGRFRVDNAGHPPPAHLDAGSGSWRLATTRGPLLGVVDTVAFTAYNGILRPGDALLLYTDGVVEGRSRDMEVGVDRLLGAAERLVPRGSFRGGADLLVEQVPTMRDDDRAVVLIWRER
jgi:serine phosphatase RsbU (regulator of sigma subunit)